MRYYYSCTFLAVLWLHHGNKFHTKVSCLSLFCIAHHVLSHLVTFWCTCNSSIYKIPKLHKTMLPIFYNLIIYNMFSQKSTRILDGPMCLHFSTNTQKSWKNKSNLLNVICAKFWVFHFLPSMW